MLVEAWSILSKDKASLDRQLRKGMSIEVAKRVDEVLLGDVMNLDPQEVAALHEATKVLRSHRLGPSTTR